MNDNQKPHSENVMEWVDKIRNHGLPAFSQTVQRLSEIAGESDPNLIKLSSLIKQDAGMTTKVLRASNSAFRSRRGRINTVSRALVMLGMKEVKRICLTCSLLDGLLSGEPDDQLVEEMTRAFHAATQARFLAIARGDNNTEEVFLSGLMRGIGPLAFCRVDPGKANKIQSIVKETGCTPEEAEKQVLGFALAELSNALVDEWDLAQYSPDEEDTNPRIQKRAHEIRLSNELTRSLTLGWESQHVKNILEEMSSQLSLTATAVQSAVNKAVQESFETAKSFGVPAAKRAIPTPPAEFAQGHVLTPDGTDEEKEKFVPPEPDQMQQLEVIRDVSSMMLERNHLTAIVVRVLEGLHHGVGLDRVLFAMLNESRDAIKARLALGPGRSVLLDQFAFPIRSHDEDIIGHVFEHNKTIWRYNEPADEVRSLITPELVSVVSEGDFFLAPIIVRDNWVGAFYADRRVSERDLDDAAYESFKQLTFQVHLAFRHFEEEVQKQ